MTFPPFDVRPAAEPDAASCRELLPEVFPAQGRPPELFVAAHGPAVLAVAAVAWVPSGFPVLVHVRPAARRQGIGRALLHAVEASVGGETPALRSWDVVQDGGPAAGFAQAAGFGVTRRFLVFETDAAEFERATTALVRRMAGRVPAGANVAPLSEAPRDAIVPLVAGQFAVWPQLVAWRLTPGASTGYDQDLSLVAMQDGVVLGAMLGRRRGPLIEIEVNVVVPAARRSWVNLLLVEAMSRRGRAAGIQRFRFSCEPHVRDTVNLARRSAATSLPPHVSMAKPLSAPV